MNREDVIKLAREAGFAEWQGTDDVAFLAVIERFAALAIAPQQKRANALAETITALRDIVTFDYESKEQFIHRVRELLSACPDTRVLQAVLDEREACVQIVENEAMQYAEPVWAVEIVNDIRARGQK